MRPSYRALELELWDYAPSRKRSNRVMNPVPPRHRTWSAWNYVAYWISDAANVSVYELASSMLAIGLSLYVSLSSESRAGLGVELGISGDKYFLRYPLDTLSSLSSSSSMGPSVQDSTYPSLSLTDLRLASGSAISASCPGSSFPCSGVVFRPSLARARDNSL